MKYALILHASREFDMDSERVLFKHRLMDVLEDYGFNYEFDEKEEE